jgi:hypothetical protein
MQVTALRKLSGSTMHVCTLKRRHFYKDPCVCVIHVVLQVIDKVKEEAPKRGA